MCEVGVAGAEGEGRRTAHVENSFAMPRSCSFSFPLLLSGIEHQQNRKLLPPAADPANQGSCWLCRVASPHHPVPRKCWDIWKSV